MANILTAVTGYTVAMNLNCKRQLFSLVESIQKLDNCRDIAVRGHLVFSWEIKALVAAQIAPQNPLDQWI